MQNRSTFSRLFLICLFILYCQPVKAATTLTKVVMTTGSLSEREGVIYVAQDQGLFRKHGLDLTFVQVRNGPVGMSALSSGETQFHWGSVSGANLGAISEGADLVFVAGFINKLTGGGWIFTMLVLDYWGLAPERDKIQFRTLGDQAVITQGLMNGAVDAAFVGYTFGKILQSKGFRLLADAEKLPIPYQGSGIMTRRNLITSSPVTLENLLRGLLDSLAFIRNPENKPQVMKSLAKGLRLARIEDAEEGYQNMGGIYEKKIHPSVDGIRNVIRLLGASNEKVRRLKAEELVDDSVVRKLEKEDDFRRVTE